jgi:hypothetical protein
MRRSTLRHRLRPSRFGVSDPGQTLLRRIARFARIAHGARRGPRSLRGAAWALPALFALASGTLLSWGPAVGAHAQSAAYVGGAASARPALQTAPRSVARWQDPLRGTELALQLTEGPAFLPGGFSFTLPNGDQVVARTSGLVNIARALPLLAPDAPFDADQSVCLQTAVISASAQSAQAFAQVASTFQAGPSSVQTGTAVLRLHVGQGGLVAYAALSFPATGKTPCSQPPNYELFAGCGGSSGPAACTPPAGPAVRVTQYDDALTKAVQTNDWSVVYDLNAQTVKGQYTPEQFSAAMAQAASQIGQITSLTVVSGPSGILYDDAGQAYFTVVQAVTYNHNGTTHTRQVTSYYLFEDGAWRFWFSQ